MQNTSATAEMSTAKSRSKRKHLVKKKLAINVRCYDNGGKTFDRYTVVFTGKYRRYTGGHQNYVGMSDNPFSPQGFGQHGSSFEDIDRPTYSHLGKKIDFDDLPKDCQQLVMSDAQDLAKGDASV